MRSGLNRIVILLTAFAFFSSCSSMYKKRKAEQEKVAQSSGLFCEFVNGDEHNDVDVEMNFQMAKKCDTSKPYNFSSYRNASEIFGLVYCCAPAKVAKETPKDDHKAPPAVTPGAGAAKPGASPTPNSNGKKPEDDIVAE